MNSMRFSLVLLAFSAFCFSGCGPEVLEIKMAPVAGKVTGKNLDAKGLGLVFGQPTGSASSNVVLKEDGSFEGEAPVGENVVYLYGAPSEGADAAMHADASSTKINESFWGETTSPWKVTVAEEGNKSITLSVDDPVGGGSSGSAGGH